MQPKMARHVVESPAPETGFFPEKAKARALVPAGKLTPPAVLPAKPMRSRAPGTLQLAIVQTDRSLKPVPTRNRRPREQRGQIIKIGGWWYLRYYGLRNVNGDLRRARLTRQICPVAGVTKARARELAAPDIEEINKLAKQPAAKA